MTKLMTTTTIFKTLLSLLIVIYMRIVYCIVFFFVFSANVMSHYFLYYQKCKKNTWKYFQFFKIPLANYSDNGAFVLDEAQKRLYLFLCPLCKLVTFLDFKEAVNECSIICLKRRQFVFKLRKQIKEERMRWERSRSKCIRRLLEEQ